MRYITELSMEDNALRFVLPTTIAPNYDPDQFTSPTSGPRNPFDTNVFGSSTTTSSSNKLSYELSFLLEFEMFCRIAGLGSPSHNIDMTFENNKAQVKLALGKTSMDKDVVIRVQLAHPNHPRCWVEQDPEGYVFYPSLSLSFALSLSSLMHVQFTIGQRRQC